MSYKNIGEIANNLGVSACFGIPGGGTSLEIIDSLENNGVPFYLSHFEGSAAIMAATVGKLSSTAGMSISIKGPGLSNALPGIAAAWFDSFPLVHVAESTPTNAPPWVAHKRLSQSQLCKVVTKSSGYLAQDGVGMYEAFEIAATEEPGPVLLEIGTGCSAEPPKIDPIISSDDDAQKVLELIRISCNPVIVAGAYAVRNKVGAELSALNIPVFSTVASKGIIDEILENAAGIFTGVDGPLTPESNVLPKADLIISIGLTAREVLAVKPFVCKSIHIGSRKTKGIEGFKFDSFLEEKYLPEILSALGDIAWGADIIMSTRERIQEKLFEGFLPGRVYKTLQEYFSRTVRLILDTGFFCTIGEHAWYAPRPDWILLSAQGRYMGTSLPMALGAAIHDSSIPTIVVVGDGGIGMYISDIKLAVQNRLPMLTILMSDNGFGSIRPRARANGFSFSPIQTDGKSWVPVLDAFGVPGDRVETEQEFERVLKAWDPSTGPAFIEIGFNPDAYEIMSRGIRI